MTGAMYSAVAGLKTHMSALNVIGNNIANVNTYGYKASRYTFDEALYTTSRNGSNGTTTMGGRNPAQIGYGCSIGTIDTDMSTKTYNPTGYGMDCMIDGDGFFIVGNKVPDDAGAPGVQTGVGITEQSELQGMTLTRLGRIDFIDGYLVDGDGNVVYGFPAVASDSPGGVEMPGGTNDVKLCKAGTVLAPIRLPKIEGQGTDAEVKYPDQVDGKLNYDDTTTGTGGAGGGVLDWPVFDSISIDEQSGRISGITQDDQVVVIAYLAIGKVDNPNGVTHVDGRYYKALDGAGNLHVTTLEDGLTQDRTNATGTPEADFDLESAGDTGIVSGGLEQSGTDLATEISNMILMQRGYQANTRIVTVTDSMLEELVNMKRG